MIDKTFWKNKKVLITGSTGFKESWLCLWLQSLGAKVTGFTRKPPTKPSLFELCEIDKLAHSILGDIRSKEDLQEAIIDYTTGYCHSYGRPAHCKGILSDSR